MHGIFTQILTKKNNKLHLKRWIGRWFAYWDAATKYQSRADESANYPDSVSKPPPAHCKRVVYKLRWLWMAGNTYTLNHKRNQSGLTLAQRKDNKSLLINNTFWSESDGLRRCCRIGPHQCPGWWDAACENGDHGVGSEDASDRPAKRAVEGVEPRWYIHYLN